MNTAMHLSETEIVSDDLVPARLESLGIPNKELLKQAADEAYSYRLEATAHHPPGFGSTLSYANLMRAARDLLVGDEWVSDRYKGNEYVTNMSLGVRIGFWNVDRCCLREQVPNKINEPGPSLREVLELNGQQALDLGESLEGEPVPDLQTWMLMVGEDGTAELSFIQKSRFVERIFLVTSEDNDLDLVDDSEDVVDEDDLDFDVELKV